ncbi:MAG TPA: FxSxx-COOH system tetratricopeptide repeat protein, partial [Thermoanaerobaculia bacterium]|nr:FxSxx-COOH system tetratricopeptide repeat protein [Thermoanaerobaculia bacterium]
MPRPVVFISYSHDSAEHRKNVLELSERLRQDGLEARLDQYINGTPEQGWPRWMLDQLDEAGFVLVVCTETYYRRFRGHEEPGRGKGADWEGAMITQEIYEAKSRTVKFVPVILATNQEPFIPEPLRKNTHYELTSEERYQDLYLFLLGKAGVEPRSLGEIRPVSKRVSQPLTFGRTAEPPPPPPSTRPTMIGVPHRNPFFTGREPLLWRLHQQLQAQEVSSLAHAVIHGLGGIGKTQTAIEYAHRFGAHYRFVFWVLADQESSIQAAYLAIARELGLAGPQADPQMAVQAVMAWLSREHGWLLIFDNANDPALVRAYLPSSRASGKVLLTSRAKSFVSVGIREPTWAEPLGSEEAVQFLTGRTGNADVKGAAELAAELGYLPLALEQAAAYIETVGGSFSEYLARYRRQGVVLLTKGRPSTNYPNTVATTWSLSVDAVRAASPASAELLTAVAFLVPDSIPIEIFTRGGTELGGLLASCLSGAVEEPLIFWELLEPLERYSLTERLPDNAFKVHRLAQHVINHSLDDESRRGWAARVIRALSTAYPAVEPKTWSLCERLQPHAIRAADLVTDFMIFEASSGRLLAQAGYYAHSRGDLARARRLEEKTLEIQEHVLGAEHPDTLTSRNNLAETLRALGDLTGARGIQEQTLEIQERVLGPEHPDTLTSRNNLAETLGALGDFLAARQIQEHTLEVQERVLGADHPDTLASRNNLAGFLSDLGDLAGAEKLLEQNLDLRERILGSEHPDTLVSRNNLA